MHSNSQDQLPDDVIHYLSEHGYSYSWSRVAANGIQSRLHEIAVLDQSAQTHRLALKEFRKSYVRTTTESVLNEYDALCRFHTALESEISLPVRTPKIIAVFPNARCYLMEYINGLSLRNNPLRNEKKGWQAASEIARALIIYHATEKTIYGDFHSGNVLRDEQGLVMIDCTPPVDWTGEFWAGSLKDILLSLDAGYWGYCTVSSIPRRLLAEPIQLIGDVVFAARIVAACATKSLRPDEESLAEIMSVCRIHLIRLKKASTRGALIAGFGLVGEKIVRWLASQYLVRSPSR